MRAFAYFSHEGKVGRGTGVKPPKSQVQKRSFCGAYCVPTHPAMGESQRIGLMRSRGRICEESAETQSRRAKHLSFLFWGKTKTNAPVPSTQRDESMTQSHFVVPPTFTGGPPGPAGLPCPAPAAPGPIADVSVPAQALSSPRP